MAAKGSIVLVSLGCAKNAVDLQVTAGDFIKKGYTLSAEPDRGDIVIVNTCSFIAAAREEAEYEIRRALELKRRGAFGKVIVTGCYPERYPEAAGAFPGVDGWYGVPDKWIEPKIPALRLTGKAYAYVKIAEGCNHRCSYCAIPSIRGRYRSRPLKSILREVRALLKTGCREINIVAQDPMLWRDGDCRLHDLLWKIDSLPGDFWVRVLYSYPSEISEEFVLWMNASRHAVKYIDMPLQHTVAEVLTKMNRSRTIAAADSAVEVLREAVDGITLRTTVMTGFPGETPLRFRRMMSDLRRMQFDHLGAFAYSPEKGTKGAALSSRPSSALAREREAEVMRQQAEIWRVKSRRMLGGIFRALVVAPGVARMQSQAPDVDGVVYLDVQGDVGEFVNVKLTKVKGFDFMGVLSEAADSIRQ